MTTVIWEVFPNTVYLMLAGLSLSLIFGLLFGVGAAVRQYGLFDQITSFVSYFGLAMPVFWFGLMLQILFAVKLGWLPSANMRSADRGGGALDLIRHLILPAFTDCDRQHRQLEPLRPLFDARGAPSGLCAHRPREGHS